MFNKDKVHIIKGYFPDTTINLLDKKYSLISLDADLYAPVLHGLEYFYPRLVSKGMIILHDYNNLQFKGAKQTVKDYEQKYGKLLLIPLCDMHGTCIIIKP
ncbi:MAG: TylF/MycF family methyltransferase [Erysipelotrichaceae bacterium]|nr:TylF/MycF family methyltransferase [Erysipelotrichaceae bacterium]